MQIMATNKKYAVAGGYTAEAVDFLGGTDYMTRSGFTGSTDGNQHTFSLWIYREGSGSGGYIVGGYNAGFGETVLMNCQTSGNVRPVVVSTSGSLLQYNATSAAPVTADTWHHVFYSRNGSSQIFKVDGTDYALDSGSFPLSSSANADLTPVNWAIGGRTDGSVLSGTVHLAEIWFDDVYVSDVTKFLSGGKPVDLGSDGSTPTGSQPLMYIKGDASTWNAGTNAGSGGNFTMTGSVDDSDKEPVEV